jgi:hypothetical protein
MSSIQEKLYLEPGLAGTLMAPEEFDSVEDGEPGYVYELINGVPGFELKLSRLLAEADLLEEACGEPDE